MRTWNRFGFTLIELLVVIAIIGILAGVLLATFGGSTESARAAHCLSNMRSLAVAANARAMATGGYPLAGSREAYGPTADGSICYWPQPGWISWLSKDKYDDGHGHERATGSRQKIDVFPFCGNDNPDDVQYALTNGVLWIASSRNRALYTCPEHILYRQGRKAPTAYFSYVMNARFGWDYTKGSGSIVAGEPYVIEFGKLTRADKTLMFAELPTVAVDGGEAEDDATGLKSDCVLQYLDVAASGTDNKKDPYASESGEAESIGFVHKATGGRRCAHVAFADGHTEKLVWTDGGVDSKTLTAYLCKGWDVTVSAAGWNLSENADKVE